VIIDAHLHCSGRESAQDVLRALDEAGVDIGVLLAPFLDPPYRLRDRDALRAANAHLGRIARAANGRVVGFAVVDPSLPDAADDLERAVHDDGLRGLKLVPSGWYPYDDAAHRVYAKAEELGLPILFHSGIFIDGRSGRFCRPVFYEAVRDHPRLRVTLAHLGWPWCDEANAVGLIDLINGVAPDRCQFRFDVSFGAPPVYRRQVFERALAVLGPGLLQFGSDRFMPCEGAAVRAAIDEVDALLAECSVCASDRQRIFGGTAAAWLGIESGVHDRSA
jgi:uncharacterized protein